ncbi:YrzO family protein [Bacillus toyonensis]|nr:YrzO family protein [Bacillus toyonensis]
MLESLLFFFAVGVACELAAINRNGRKKVKQQAELIQLLKELKEEKFKKTTGHRRSSFSIYKGKGDTKFI